MEGLVRQVYSGSYLGGHPARQKLEKTATLQIYGEGIQVGVWRTFINEPWDNITGLTAEGPDEVQTRFTATRFALLGPLALAFKKDKKTQCFIVAEGTFGEFIFQVKKKSPQELRAALAPWRPFYDAEAASAVLAAMTPEQRAELGVPDELEDGTTGEPAELPPGGAGAGESPVAVAGGGLSAGERIELLKQLAELRAQGALTEEEFVAEKERLREL